MRVSYALLGALFLLAALKPAQAEDRTPAEEAFFEGRELMEEERYEEACEAFSRAFELDPAPGTLLNLALCQESLGDLATAHATYLEAAELAASEDDETRERAGLDRADELEPRVPRLKLELMGEVPEDLEVRKSGEDITDKLGEAHLVDPGEYALEATAPGRLAWEQEVAVAEEGESVSVAIPELRRAHNEPCAGVTEIEHQPIHSTTGLQPLPVLAEVGPELDADRVLLHYRTTGTTKYDTVEMFSVGDCEMEAHIPEFAFTDNFVYYYISAQRADRELARSGSAGTPYIIGVTGQDARGEAFVQPDDERPAHAMFAMLSSGAGGGLVGGETEITGDDVSCCFGASGLHVIPEIGISVDHSVTLSLAARLGFPIGATAGGRTASSGLLRLRYSTSDDVHGPFIGFTVGAGIMRNTVSLHTGDTDTVASGPVLLGAGGGYSWQLNKYAELVAELHAMAGIPVVDCIGDCGSEFGGGVRTNFALQFDASAGILLSF